MKATSNNNNIESKNGVSQVINILTGETKKMRCHYLSKRNDKPVSRVLTLERLNHPVLTAAGVTAWGEHFNDGVNRFDFIRVYIQLTDNLCYMPNCANNDLPSIEHYNDYDDVNRQNVDNFFQSIAAKPAKMMKGEDWPNTAVIAAYKAAGRDQEAETLTAARDIYEARRESDKEAWRKKYAAQQTYHNSPRPENFDDLTELEKAQFMVKTVKDCANEHPELDWSDITKKATGRLEKAITAKFREQITDNTLHGCGCIISDGDEDRKDSMYVKVHKAYTNDSNNPEDWMYCVAWYDVEPTEDGNGYCEKIVECENGITIDQAARHMAYFELMAAKGWTLNEILYGKAA